MDSRDWLYVKVFVALYVGVTALAALGGSDTAWLIGVYAAVAGTLVFAVALVGKEWIGGRTAS